ncbi:MAG: DUF2726 domain-containing protein [Acidobacteria bacterium]|nr:DUF2726 domain-containing protein [Acidobacteriota bacterium]
MRKLLNFSEDATLKSLTEACAANGAVPFAKVRIGDVLDIEGLEGAERRLAFGGHFDFVIADKEHLPLFAVEFDGPGHSDAEAAGRDKIKDGLCVRAGLPLLRITAEYLGPRYANMALLRWLIDSFFLQRAFEEAQERGEIPPDEPYIPTSVVGDPSTGRWFPYWLSKDTLARIRTLAQSGSLRDMIANTHVGYSTKDEDYRGVFWIMINDHEGVLATTRLKAQLFPVDICDLVDEIGIVNLGLALEKTLRGELEPMTAAEIKERVEHYRRNYRICMAGGPV